MPRFLIALTSLCALLAGCAEPDGMHGNLDQFKNANPIVGGFEVHSGQFGSEFVVMIYTQNELGQPSVCTGTFISNTAILTAAHCVNKKPENMVVTFSDQPFVSMDIIHLKVTKSVVHPKYKKSVNDLALVFFEGGLPEGAQKIAVAEKPWLILKYQKILALGYGRIEGLEESTDFSQELGILRGVNIPTKNTLAKLDGFYIEQKDFGVCFGDSGGPAIILNEVNQPVLVGVANAVISAPNIDDFCKHKSVYLDIGFYDDWLKITLKASKKSLLK